MENGNKNAVTQTKKTNRQLQELLKKLKNKKM